MVYHFRLLVALVVITTSLAAPAARASSSLVRRGPSNFILEAGSPLFRRSAPNYSEDWTSGKAVDYTNSSTGFDLTWDTPDDFVVGVGWNPGSTAPITFNGSFSVDGGTGLLSVYGWTTDPLIEYFIVEDNIDPPSFGTQKGYVISDGSTYTIWKNIPDNTPPIQGPQPLTRYYSVRGSPRVEGTVTVENHFNAWASLGLDLGTLNYQIVAVEAYGGSGSASYTVSNWASIR